MAPIAPLWANHAQPGELDRLLAVGENNDCVTVVGSAKLGTSPTKGHLDARNLSPKGRDGQPQWNGTGFVHLLSFCAQDNPQTPCALGGVD